MFLGTFTICFMVFFVIAAIVLSFIVGRFDAFDKGYDQGYGTAMSINFYRKTLLSKIEDTKIVEQKSRKVLPSYIRVVK